MRSDLRHCSERFDQRVRVADRLQSPGVYPATPRRCCAAAISPVQDFEGRSAGAWRRDAALRDLGRVASLRPSTGTRPGPDERRDDVFGHLSIHGQTVRRQFGAQQFGCRSDRAVDMAFGRSVRPCSAVICRHGRLRRGELRPARQSWTRPPRAGREPLRLDEPVGTNRFVGMKSSTTSVNRSDLCDDGQSPSRSVQLRPRLAQGIHAPTPGQQPLHGPMSQHLEQHVHAVVE